MYQTNRTKYLNFIISCNGTERWLIYLGIDISFSYIWITIDYCGIVRHWLFEIWRIVKIKFDIRRLYIVSPRIFGLTLRVLKLNELFTRRDDLLYNPTRQQQPLVTHNKRDRAVVKKSGTITWIDKQYDIKTIFIVMKTMTMTLEEQSYIESLAHLSRSTILFGMYATTTVTTKRIRGPFANFVG